MGTLVLAGATSGSATLTPVDAVTAVITLPSATATLATLGANTFTGNQAITGTLSVSGAVSGSLLPPVFGRVVRTAGDVTTTSSSLVDVTGATVTFTTKARPVMVGFACAVNCDVSLNQVAVNIDVDGSLQLGTQGIQNSTDQAGGYRLNASLSHQTASLTAASHTLKMQFSTSAGTGTITAGTGNALSFWANEL